MTTEGAEHEHKDDEKKDDEKKDEAQAEKKDDGEAHAEKKDEGDSHAEKKDEGGHDDHGHGHAAAASNPFTDAQIADMHSSDRVAARNIVLLLFGIFLIGVGIYAYVAYSVASGWWAT